MSEEPTVSYTVKESLARIDGKLDSLTLLMQTKADRADVLGLHERLTVLEAAQHSKSGTWRSWKVAAAAFAFVAQTAALWATVLVRH